MRLLPNGAQADPFQRRIETCFVSYPASVTEKTPPTFIVQTEDDPVHVENALVYYQALKNAKVPAEMHIYSEGGHGYGLRRPELPVTKWPESVEVWLRTIHVLNGSKTSAMTGGSSGR